MDVLLIGVENPVGAALKDTLAHSGRHRVISLTSASSRWTRERHAKKAVRKDKPNIVVDMRLAWQVAAGEVPQSLDVERSHWLAKACEHSGMRYIFLSSDQVFSGQSGRSLREDDPTDASSEPGLQLVEAESRVLQAAPSALVLRTGPLFSSLDRNLLSITLSRMLTETNVVFDHQHRFCPVASAELARVISALLDQLSVGADAGGVYHYCSGDRTTEYEFAEVLLAAAGQYSECGDVVISAGQSDEPAELRSLDCTRLRDGFAIKQVAWRTAISPAVREYCGNLATRVKQ